MLDTDLNLNEFCGKTNEELAVIARTDNNAANALILRFSKLIFVKAEIFSFHASDTDDFRQEGLIGLMNAIYSYDCERGAKFSTYAEACINNKMRSLASKLAKKADICRSLDELPEDAVSMDETPENIYINKEYFSELWNAIDTKLTANEKEAFTLRIQGLSYRQIAENLGISVKDVDNAVQRARKKLRSCVSEN